MSATASKGSWSQRGFTLVELMVTLTVLTILTLSVLPLVKNSIKRQRETELRSALREMREAIDQFHRDTEGMESLSQGGGGVGGISGGGGVGSGVGGVGGTGGGVALPANPRSQVVISDTKLFTVDNPDRYPPDLETLVKGVNVIPRNPSSGLGGGGLEGNKESTVLGNNASLATKKKVYLRKIPIDPMTGEADWDVHSCYDEPDSTSTGGENVWDVRSKSKEVALNGEKYSDW